MLKPRLVPLYFDPGRDEGFDTQLARLKQMLGDQADILAPVALGQPLPDADAVIFPQMLGQAYRSVAAFQQLGVPILVVTSEFGTIAMWDWEILDYLRDHNVRTLAPYSFEQTRTILSALRVKRQLAGGKYLVFQDDPGQGAQAPIFKRFYWWEDESSERMRAKFGVTIEKRSFRELGAEAHSIPDHQAQQEWERWQWSNECVTGRPLLSAVKLYLAVKRHLDADSYILGAGINCLNESHFSDTTPCLAWAKLYEERRLIWGCEADTMSMLSKYILHNVLDAPILMTNLYPFLLGQAALAHERISNFPQVDAHPEDHILIAHCGFMGVIPRPFAARWTFKPKVLAIVDDNATAIDADLPTGPVTLAKLRASLSKMTVAEGQLKGYAQFPGSDCLNGGVVQVRDGHQLMRKLASHHYLLLVGHHLSDIRLLGNVLDIEVDTV